MNRRICTAVFDSDLIATRLILAIAETIWALLLWWPGDTFGRPTYAIMACVMPEDAWGALFAVTACMQVLIVAGGKFLSLEARAFAAWNTMLWFFVVTSMVMSVQPPPAAIAGEIALALAAGWIWVRPMILAHWYRKAYGSVHG